MPGELRPDLSHKAYPFTILAMSAEKLVEELVTVAPSRDSYLTIGVFDGVHLGHRHLLELLKEKAAQAHYLAGVFTFRNHPQTVLTRGLSISYITSLEERVRLLHTPGIDFVTPVTFTQELSRVGAREFVALLQQHLQMRGLVVGPDFALGHRREGTIEVLQALGEELGFSVTVAKPLTQRNRTVSTTSIRAALARGDVQKASTLLGRPFALEGKVVPGAGRGGSLLGYPTANIRPDPRMAIPGDGIYATWAYIDSPAVQVGHQHRRPAHLRRGTADHRSLRPGLLRQSI